MAGKPLSTGSACPTQHGREVQLAWSWAGSLLDVAASDLQAFSGSPRAGTLSGRAWLTYSEPPLVTSSRAEIRPSPDSLGCRGPTARPQVFVPLSFPGNTQPACGLLGPLTMEPTSALAALSKVAHGIPQSLVQPGLGVGWRPPPEGHNALRCCFEAFSVL